MAVSFGVTSTGGYGILQSVSHTQTAEIAEVRNASGLVTNQQAYSRTKEVTAEGIFDGDTLGSAGGSLTVGDVTGLITNLTVNETNTGYKSVSVTVQLKDSATLTALS